MPAFCILGAGCLWSTIGIFVRKFTLYGIDSLQVVFFRSLVTAASLVLLLLLTGRERLKIHLRDLWCFAGTGICSIVFFNFCYFQTIKMTSLAVAAILLYTAPILVTVLSAILFREKITPRKTAALCLAFLGCILVTGVLGGGAGVPAAALLFGLGSGLGYALYSIFGRFALRRYDCMTVTAYTFVFASAGCLPFLNVSFLFRTAFSVPGLPAMLIFSGVVTGAVPYVLYTFGLNRMETSHASIMASIEPVMASLIGIAFYREQATVASVAGSLLVLGAVFLLNGQPQKEKGLRRS